jgi:uncharacterized protein YndB with AHSA1/START domain
MQQITASKKFTNGIQVFWSDKGTEKSDVFSYEDLIGLKINAFDLLENPRSYRINPAGHQIETTIPGCDLNSCEGEIVISRLFDASRELSWRVWTEPELIMRWWGPKGFTAPSCKNDLKVGGTYLYCMRSPDGQDFWSTGIYQEIVKPERIVCTDSFADEKGNIVPATYYGMSPDFPREMLLTVTFREQAGRTRLTLQHTGLPPGEVNDLTRSGWNQSLDKYSGVLSTIVFGGGKVPVVNR